MDNLSNKKIQVLYDGACPTCVKDRRFYERLAGIKGQDIEWLDFNQFGSLLVKFQIAPIDAMLELHVIVEGRHIVKELDAYILLLSHITWLKPLALVIQIPFIKAPLARYYRYRVQKRLRRTGRL